MTGILNTDFNNIMSWFLCLSIKISCTPVFFNPDLLFVELTLANRSRYALPLFYLDLGVGDRLLYLPLCSRIGTHILLFCHHLVHLSMKLIV